MALGRQRDQQSEMLVTWAEMPRSPGGTVKLLALGRASWQAEGDAGTEFKPRQQPR